MNLDAVELDPSIVEVARHWFGFQEDARMKIHACDGFEYLQEAASKGKTTATFI